MRRAAAAAVLLGGAAAKDSWLLTDDAYQVLEGCYYQDSKYDEPAGKHVGRLQEKPAQAADFKACQKLCQEDDLCVYFTYELKEKNCFKLGQEAVFHFKADKNLITGPKFCPEIPSGCTEIADKGFPGRTDEETSKMFPSGRQPTKLECWPRDADGGVYNSCPKTTVLEDHKYGWPGLCTGLTARSGSQKLAETEPLPSGETCESDCLKNPLCSLWAVVEDEEQTCWQAGEGSDGRNCWEQRDDGFPGIKGAQRIMHGEVRVIADLVDTQLWGLKNAFPPTYFVHQEPDAVEACRNHCYSNIRCQYWQYSRITGCWIEEASYRTQSGDLQYPLTTEKCTDHSRMAHYIIAGEYIQHVCPGTMYLPEKFSNSFVPKDLPYTKPAETVADVYKAYEAEFPCTDGKPCVHGAPPVNNHVYGSAAYRNHYLAHGWATKAAADAAAAGAPAAVASPAATTTTTAAAAAEATVGPVALQLKPAEPASDATDPVPVVVPAATQAIAPVLPAATPAVINPAGASRLYEERSTIAAVEPTSRSPTMAIMGGAALTAVVGMSVFAFRRSRSTSLSVNVAMELVNQETDSEQPLMPSA